MPQAPQPIAVLAAVMTLALLVAGCALDIPVADIVSGECLPEDEGQPNCNGDRRKDECTELGLPTAYGVDTGCQHPVRPQAVNRCVRRPEALKGCTKNGGLTCCPE